jgi:hypothetical protein
MRLGRSTNSLAQNIFPFAPQPLNDTRTAMNQIKFGKIQIPQVQGVTIVSKDW